ncbi:MAG: DNA polymerase I [Planctomycetaceae bacterium]|nr:DNA polymerase I [Planctomycetaceae bacterium]
MPDTLYIVDTYSLIFQVYHAIRQPMQGTRGQPTNAIFGITGDLQHLIKEKQPTHLICAMDHSGPGERETLYPQYKANRSAMPDDLRPQIPAIVDVLNGYRIPVIEHAGWEADDVIATLARRAAERGMEVRIVTNDKDARQLIGPRIKLYNIRKKQFMDEAALLEDWGVRPDQVVDFQSLVGDSVDNVPGVPLVGPKKASDLLQRFGTLEEVLAHADEAPGKKLQENLKTYADQARLSRELVRLRDDLPLEIDWDKACIQEPDCRALLELFTDFGFRRYSDEMRLAVSKLAPPRPDSSTRTFVTVDDAEKFATFLAGLQQARRICFDTETTGIDPTRADLVGLAFCWEPHTSYYLPVRGPAGVAVLDQSEVVAALRPIFADPSREFINQNIKYDLIVLRRAGIEVAHIGLDPMIGDYLLDSGARTHGLDELAKRYLQRGMIPITELIGKGKTQLQMFDVEVERAAEYASEDVDVALQIADIIQDKLQQQELWDLYWNLERPLIPVLADMEWTGIKVDVAELKRQSADLAVRLDALMHEIYETAGHEFNIASPKQLATVLFDELGLPVLKRTKTGPSTAEDVLERLAHKHPLPAKIIEHRQLSKLKGTYLDALPALVNPETGRLHTSFSQVTAATGRLSSSDPNLQNIPIRTEEGRRIRKAFIPHEPGWKLVCADYSQIELRMLAHYSGDRALVDAFESGLDIHTAVASEVYGVETTDVTSDMRRVAKAVNFGVIYGQTSYGLAALLGIPQADAADFIDAYFLKYAGVARFIEETLDLAHKQGFVTTIMGRRREINGVRSIRPDNLNIAERTAVNTVMQGSAADLIKKAMISLHARLQREQHPARMLLQIHDELVFEAPADAVESLQCIAREEMTGAIPLHVPLVVDIKSGDNWLDAK